MKNFLSLTGLLFGVLFLFPTRSQAQWQKDVRLTNDPAVSYSTHNSAWSVAASGDTVHVVWQDRRDDNGEIYYKRSTDGGLSWGPDLRMTNNPSNSLAPSVTVTGSLVLVVWNDQPDVPFNTEIFCARSTDGGVTWGTNTRLTNDPSQSYFPSVTISGQVVHLVWQDFRDGNSEIYYKRSTDGGTSWGPDTRLTNDIYWSDSPCVSVSGQVVHIGWQDERSGNGFGVIYRRSSDGGTSWGVDTLLSGLLGESFGSCVAVSGSVVHVAWHTDRDSNYEIYYKRSTDGGKSWGADTNLTNNPAESDYPSLAVSGQVVHLVWIDVRDGNTELYYKRSTDGGTSWGADTRLTNNSATSWGSSVAVSGQAVHVVWYDERDGNDEIYYKRNPTGNVTGVQNRGSAMPKEYALAQNYPNPFNPATAIPFVVGTYGRTSLQVYDLLGREVATLVDAKLQPGSYEATWDASGMASGVYLYRLNAAGSSFTRKMVLVR